MVTKFKEKLSKWMESEGMSRKDLIAKLQVKYYDEFKGLDTITLCRWLNGMTIPPIYKQIYIAKCLNADILEYIRELDLSLINLSRKNDVIICLMEKAINFSLSTLSYIKIGKNIQFELIEQSFQEHYNAFGSFYENIPPIAEFTKSLYGKAEIIKYTSILIKNDDGQMIGHWTGIQDIEILNGIPGFICIPKDEISRSSLVGQGNYINSAHYFELIVQVICFFLVKLFHRKDFLYMFLYDFKPVIDYCKIVLNAESVKYYAPDKKSKMGVYLFKFNIIKSISNPSLLLKVQDKLKCLAKCNPKLCNNKCNLLYVTKGH